ncbi:DNA repair protein RecO [Ferviditalea candida]|uniref:DNA repair protein RecO n=1 Tax=Ferviditalea candida TaxID=3108399 RepID=A0ABU5ZEP0_9BACL|nr:DNA repair protein RecO [Paenibacillaceae bacterium T2]
MLNRIEGIVIRAMDYGEGHKIITLYTKEAGRVTVMARGAKKLKSRFSAIAQLFTYGEFVFFKTGAMGTLNHGEIIRSHHLLREDLLKAAYASYIAEMIDRMTEHEAGSSALFEQLEAAFEAIEDGKDPQIVAHVMEMKILEFSGYGPEFEACVSCGRETGLSVLSFQLGGVLCSPCQTKDPSARHIEEGTWKLLRLFRRMDLRRLGKISVKNETKKQIKPILRGLMDTHIGIQWKARNFLDQMEKYEI